jgi:ABC-type dipeptide/oligopeptide/nickel transport system ATPase component
MDTLDEHLLDIEEVLKDKSDETFRQILETYQSQVNEFHNLFKSYSLSTSKDLLAIQKASEESVKKLQDYVSSDPHLQELLTKAQEENVVREKIIQLVSREEELMRVPEKKVVEEVTIPGYEQRIMVPYKHMVLPSEITTITNPMFDERVPFSKRKETLLQRLEKREKEGEIFHKKVPQIAVDIMEGDWPYLWGPSGTGKSYMAKQVASLLGMDLTKAGKITEPYSILGYNDPQGRYQITPSFIAALYGNLLFLDELDNGNPDTQVVLNDIYSELLNKLDDPSEICEVTFGTDVNVDIHPNFRMIGAGNTSGEGENEAFSSRGKMDESIQERMTPIYIDYDNRVEQQILNDYPEWYKFFIDFRDACKKYADSMGYSSAQGITTTRDAAAIKKYIMHNSKSVDQVIAERFVQIKDSEYRKALGNTIADIYGISYQDCQNPNYKGSLEKVDRKVLAKKFITACKKGVE